MQNLQPLSLRVLSRLEQAKAQELDPWMRDDLQIAYLTVLYAGRGDAVVCAPHVLATYKVLGVHPEKVWPRIFARKLELGLLQDEVAPPRKKPAQSVKLWPEKTNAVRVSGSYGGDSFWDKTISVPMAAPSIAALYTNSDAPSSAKTREYSLLELKRIVAYSGAPAPVCNLTISALRARGEWPNENGPATAVLSVAILGMMFEGVCCRSTVQRRIKRAVKEGYWRRVRDANSWIDCPKCSKKRTSAKCECGYRGRSRDEKGKWTGEFMRVPVYEFDVRKFQSAQRCREIRHFDARTYLEYKESAKRGEHPNVTEMPSRKPAQPAPPANDPPPTKVAPVKQPAAEHAHRGIVRPEPKAEQPKLTKRECAKFVADLAVLMKGRGEPPGRTEPDPNCSKCNGSGEFETSAHPGQLWRCGCWSPPDPHYRPKMAPAEALRTVCERWHREVDSVRHALKFWGYQLQE